MTGRELQRNSGVLMIIFLIVLVSGTSGCIKVVRNSLEPVEGNPPGSEDRPGFSGPGTGMSGLQPKEGFGETRTEPGSAENVPVVLEASPIRPEDPYPLLHGVRITVANDTFREPRVIGFEKTYCLRSNASGLLVDVDRPPLILSFVAYPRNDCIENPHSCRSTLTSPVHRPHFTLTVRDNTTRDIVLEDGYGYKYSSGTENRTFRIYRGGTYHITLDGEFVDVWLGIATGASPLESEVLRNAEPAQTPVPPGYSDEYWY